MKKMGVTHLKSPLHLLLWELSPYSDPRDIKNKPLRPCPKGTLSLRKIIFIEKNNRETKIKIKGKKNIQN
jgi:hypothetical protein